VIFLGDYIYEYETTGYAYNPAVDRPYDPEEEILDLSDYRTRHSQYKLDDELRVLHQNFPFICLWDDHEFADNAWNYGAENHQPVSEGDWLTRVAAAEEAYFDWMPVQKNNDTIFPFTTYRSFALGDLMDLWVLDTRIDDRDKQVSYFDFDWDDSSRHIISLTQRNWLFDGLKNSDAQWKVIGQQVMVSPLTALGVPINDDQWDGYPKDQEALLQFLRDSIPNNKVILTGDIHSSWANDVATPSYDAGTHE
ncbi:MAG TPA: alkaline phosphatase D family protein, partial [Chitinophagales bacterium]|nr:alkaline phosphatase D family protein [Chitinophagales bacterium]